MITRFRNIGLVILLLLAGRMAAQVPVLDSVCPGTGSHYRVSGEPGSTYSWILTDPFGIPQQLPSTADTCWIMWGYAPGTYILEVIQHSINACDADAVYGQIFVFDPPQVFAGIDQTIANGTSTTIGDATISGLEPLAFMWDPPDQLVNPFELHPTTVNLNVTTTFRLLVKDANGCENMDEIMIIVEGGVLAVDPTADPEEICLGVQAQLFANASGGSGIYTYDWTSNPPGFSSDEANPFVSPAQTTTYTVTVNDGFNQATGSVTVTVNPLPLAFAGADQIIMSGSSTIIADATASGANPMSYSWEPAALLIDPTVLNPLTLPLTATTTFSLSVTDANGCENSDEVTIFIQTEPLAVDPYAEPELICLNGFSVLYANASGGFGVYTYNWTSIPPGFTSTEENPVVSPVATTTYFVEVSDGFNTVTGSVTVTVLPGPDVYAGADQTIANGSFTIISDATASGAEPLDYSWTPATLLIDPTVINPTTVNLISTTTFTLTVTDANYCVNQDEVMIIVAGGPLAVDPFAEPEEVCQGETVQLFANANGGSGLYTYSWTSNPPGFISTDANPFASPDETTAYTVVVSDGFNTVSGSVTVTVHEPPEVFAGFNKTIPYGTSTTIDDASVAGTGPFTYDWTPADSLADPTVLFPTTVNLHDTITFLFTVTDGNGCQNTDYVTISVAGDPLAVNPLAVPTEICLGETAQLFGNASGGSGVYSYSWTSVPPGFTSDIENPSASPAVTTTYTIKVNDGFNTVSGSITIVVNPLPIVSCPANFNICGDSQAFALTDATPAGGTYIGMGVYLDNGTYYFDPSTGAGTYPVTYSYSDTNGCSSTCLFTITVTAPPQVVQTIVTDETDGLGNGSIEIVATGVTPLLFYSIDNGATWQTNNGLFTNLSAATYYCIVQDENGCDTNFTLNLVNVALNMLEAITGPDSLCLGKAAAVPLKVEGFTAVATFQLRLSYNFDKLICTGWTNSHPALGTAMTGSVLPDGEILLQWQSTVPVTILAQATICDLVFTTREPGQGQLDWYTNATESFFTGIAGQPIPAEFYAGQVVIYEPPVIEMPETLYACVGQPLIIPGDVEGINPPFSYQWIYPIGLTDSIQPYFSSVTLADAGVYTLLVTDAMGCTDRKTTRLEVSENPVAAFHGIDTMQVVYGYVLDAGGGMISYLWNTGETTQSIETKTEGWYIVELMSEAGCIGIDSVYILWLQVCIDVPNAFTPNSDGLNDIFLAESVCPISYFRMIIYNRWGEKLFESHDITVGWDGTLNGVPCPGDTYVYVVSYIVGESPGSEVKGEKAGMLLLLK